MKPASGLFNEIWNVIRWLSFFPLALVTCTILFLLFDDFYYSLHHSEISEYIFLVVFYCLNGIIFILTGAIVAPIKILASRILLTISFVVIGTSLWQPVIQKDYFSSIILFSFLIGSVIGYFAIKKLSSKRLAPTAI